MSCRAGDVACELQQIVDALNGWSWPTFASTLVATLVGAGIALLGTALLAHRDRRERYQTRLDEALSRVLTLAAAYIEALEKETLAMEALDKVKRTRRSPVAPGAQLRAAIEAVRLVARGDRDSTIALRLWFACLRAVEDFDLEVARDIPDTILRWRRSGDTVPNVLFRLKLSMGEPAELDFSTRPVRFARWLAQWLRRHTPLRHLGRRF